MTDVAFDPDGNIYFSDGYNNSRVAKYDSDGNWVGSWGERGSEPGQFRLPHGIAADDQGRIYVADRSNNRIQVFESDGTFVRQITLADLRRQAPVPADYAPQIASFGRLPDGSYNSLWPNSICITPGPDPVIFTQVPRPHLPDGARRHRAGLLRPGRSGRRPVRLDPRPGVPVGERGLGRRAPDLARPEGNSPRLTHVHLRLDPVPPGPGSACSRSE